MKAVIMAGGKGTRLSSLTNDEIPKPMVRICGKPILEHQIITLKTNGITDIIIIGGYLFDNIVDYFKDGQDWNVNITYIREEQPLGTAGALFYLKEIIKESFFLVYGDIIFDIDVLKFAKEHEEKKAIVSILVHPNSHPYDSDVIEVNEMGFVIGFLSKKLTRKDYYANIVNAGLYMISSQLLFELGAPVKCDLEHDLIFTKHMEKGQVFAYRTTEYVKDVGTPERLKSSEADMRQGVIQSRNFKNKQKCIFLDRDGTINQYKGLLYNIEDMELEEGAAEAIAMINQSGYLCIVITNQPVVARNLCTIEQVKKIHDKMETLLGEKGAYLDDIYFCPHHPDKGYPDENVVYKIACDCRKPEIGLILKCMVKYNIDLNDSWFIGDTTSDVQTGINADVRTILVGTGMGGQDKKYNVTADFKSESLLEAVEFIVNKSC